MLGIYDVDEKFPEELSENCDAIFLSTELKEDLPHIDKLFVDWMPRLRKSEYARQAEIILHYVNKGIKTVIFDRYLDLDEKEYSWLKKHDVVFLEPVLKGERKFKYLPQWIEIPKKKYKVYNDNREIDLAFSGPLAGKFIPFERYYVRYANKFNKKAVYDDFNIHRRHINDYKNANTELENFKWKNVRRTIVIGKQEDYERGYIDEMFFNAMKNGCLPLLPYEHKYFHLMFQDLVVFDDYTLRWLMSKGADAVSNVLIMDIYERIETYYPEFTSKHASDIISKELNL